MLFTQRIVAVALTSVIALFLLLRPNKLRELSPLQYLKTPGKAFPEILNSTLGFQQVFVLNLPERTDRRDAMTIAAGLSGIDVTWIDGIAGKDVLDKVLPGDSYDKSISRGNKGSWRAHMDALQRVIQDNLTSALILEDDADWDIRLRPQLQVFAQAARAFTQSTTASPGRSLAESFPANSEPQPEISIEQIRSDRPTLTPYGDDWDVLWLGHCGTEFPAKSIIAQNDQTNDQDHRPPLLRVKIVNDPTVPKLEHLKGHPFALTDALGELYPPHTRVVHASSETACSQGYAVSQQGARKLLWQFGLQTLTAGWDLMLRDWCDGLYSGGKNSFGDRKDGRGKIGRNPVCVTVQPPLFSHHYGKGAASDISAPGGGFVNKDKEMTPYIRLSVRLNMGRMVQGVELEDLIDQFPDEKL